MAKRRSSGEQLVGIAAAILAVGVALVITVHLIEAVALPLAVIAAIGLLVFIAIRLWRRFGRSDW